MATSSALFARSAIEAVWEVCPSAALLHGIERVAGNDQLSDLDVATDLMNPKTRVQLLSALAMRDLLPVVVWPYDTGAATVMLATTGLQEGVQLDLLQTPSGRGKYGIRTGVALANAVNLEWGRSLSPVDTWLYQLRKRILKNQHTVVAQLLDCPPAIQSELHRRIDELFVPRHAAVVHQVLDGALAGNVRTPLLSELTRLGRRLARPAGLSVHVRGGEENVAELVGRLNRFMPLTAAWPAQSLRGHERLSRMSQERTLRWRAGVFVTWGVRDGRADVSLESGGSIDVLGEAFRQAVTQRAAKHFEKLQGHTIR